MEDLRGRDAAGPPDAKNTEPDVLDASSRSLSLVVSPPPPPARMRLEEPAPLPEMPILLIDPTGPLVDDDDGDDDDDFRNLLIDAAPVLNIDEEEDFKRPEDEDRFD